MKVPPRSRSDSNQSQMFQSNGEKTTEVTNGYGARVTRGPEYLWMDFSLRATLPAGLTWFLSQHRLRAHPTAMETFNWDKVQGVNTSTRRTGQGKPSPFGCERL
ncbi:hypothetical protein CC1G_09042 [Coprinopsis cinerea okayama7|uniref:Uncharacterized protein n=1 Tax=Coprinopsis cinerea (strain Okayama-7 / 130 / ATCC MYA-4618 / FGSC 9003) TaxID=240176 RepID=A8P2W8_COPC7|nr:hypothetical protein CC1G_09042 [Coprinopsis cinerea okayama7\|eukprot:XP_001838414.2 hypothetical protein CC1G_09042 [Coprinopsis cinerea okayama7\